jgi:hypothetical protein
MQWDGDEKRIRALFSELSFEDQDRAPLFDKLWRQAQATVPAPSRSLTAIAVICAVIILVVSLIGAGASFTSTQSLPQQQTVNVNPQTTPTPAARSEQEPNPLTLVAVRPPHRKKRLVLRRTNERIELAQVAVLTSWQSPTAVFLESSARPSFNSLPQLNQSADDLKSFLPKQVMKESNQ